MEAPQCNNKNYENFTLAKKFCKANKVHAVFSSVALKDWCNFDLIIPKIIAADSSASLKKYTDSLDVISQKLVRHPYVQGYAFRIKKYLKKDRVQASYDQKFESEQQKAEIQRSKNRLNHTNQLLSHAELTFESTVNLSEVNKRIKLVKESMGSESSTGTSTEEAINTDTEAEETYIPGGFALVENDKDAEDAKISNNRKNVQSVIYSAGKELHRQYKAGSNLNFIQMKTMKCGLSNIIDLSEQNVQFSQRSLFSPEVWAKLVEKYSRFLLSPEDTLESFKDKWEAISDLCIVNKDPFLAKKYISTIEASSTITPSQLRTLDLFREIIYLVDSRSFMLNQANRAKISERDFTYQLWLPIFQKVFHVNSEIVRIKVGETVLSESTESKVSSYSSSRNIVGFKVDMRFLLDFEAEEFDLACAEACVPVVTQDKIHHDMSKLLREGKIMQTAALNTIQDNSVYSWVIQISGPTCNFYTIHNTKHQYHVCIHQFKVVFPSGYSELPSFLKSLSNIFMFHDSLEATANNLKAAILKTRSSMKEGSSGVSSPSAPTVFESASVYHTPPHRNSSNSQMPFAVSLNELTESDLGSSQGSASHLHNTEADAFGFVRNNDEWTNLLTGKTYSDNPYKL